IKKPIAGIALGLVKEQDDYKILTDILGIEDHYGDMDFKAAGSIDGITAIQMDLKIDGVSIDILRDILEKSKKGRNYILDKMNKVIEKPKDNLSDYVPKMFIMKVNPDKIGSVIGPSGRNIKKIIEESDTGIDIKDNGEIFITADTTEKIDKAKYLIEGLVREVKAGEIYTGKVKRITKYGAFVEILPGVEGLLHISNLCHYHDESAKRPIIPSITIHPLSSNPGVQNVHSCQLATNIPMILSMRVTRVPLFLKNFPNTLPTPFVRGVENDFQGERK
ncbi:MAG: KH domain-containing protein, partial [Candidatus Syntrophosphaera sp.]